jgi:hypothetical protein
MTDHADRGLIEPLVLAAGLSAKASADLLQIALRSKDARLLFATVTAHRNGACLDDQQIRAISTALIRQLSGGSAEGWLCWPELLSLPFSSDLVGAIDSATAAYDGHRRQLVRATLALRFRNPAEICWSPAEVLSILTVKSLPALPFDDSTSESDRFGEMLARQAPARLPTRGAGVAPGVEA